MLFTTGFNLSSAGNEAVGFQYVTSLYWAAATSASVGYGDIHAHTTTEVTRKDSLLFNKNKLMLKNYSIRKRLK